MERTARFTAKKRDSRVENKVTNYSCGELKQCSERKNRRRRGKTEWEEKANGESAKEEEKKRRRMYQCLRAVGGLPGAL